MIIVVRSLAEAKPEVAEKIGGQTKEM